VSEEEHDLRLLGPQIAEASRVSVGIHHNVICKRGNIERHGGEVTQRSAQQYRRAGSTAEALVA